MNYQGSYVLLFQNTANGSTVGTAAAAFTPTANTWYHIAASFNGPTDTTFYVNGLGQTTVYNNTSSTNYAGTADFTVGVDGGGNYFDGTIFDVRLYNTNRTATQIASDYNKKLKGNEANLKGWWPLNPLIVHVGVDSNVVELVGATNSATLAAPTG